MSDGLTKVEKLKAQYRTAAERIRVLEAASRNAKLLFDRGMANYLEVITAQGNLLQSELQLSTVKNWQLNAVVGLGSNRSHYPGYAKDCLHKNNLPFLNYLTQVNENVRLVGEICAIKKLNHGNTNQERTLGHRINLLWITLLVALGIIFIGVGLFYGTARKYR